MAPGKPSSAGWIVSASSSSVENCVAPSTRRLGSAFIWRMFAKALRPSSDRPNCERAGRLDWRTASFDVTEVLLTDADRHAPEGGAADASSVLDDTGRKSEQQNA